MITTTRIRTTPNTSSSTSITDTVNGEHDFKVSDYSNTKGIGIGKHVSSDKFTVGGYSWAIFFYPDGKRVEDNATYVSLYIALASEGTDVRALFEVILLDQSGKERHKVHSHFRRYLQNGPFKLKQKSSMWGYRRFFRRSTLETSDYLKDDCLLIHCRVGVIGSRIEHPETYSIHVPPSDIGRHLGQLLECGKGTDVSFEVKGETFLAHKLVLAARSPVFRAQLFGPMRDENSKCVKIEDMEPPIFKICIKALLHFMYWDSLPNMEELTGLNTKWNSTLMFQHLLAATDLYGLGRLKLICERNLCQNCCDKPCVSNSLLCLKFSKL